MFSTFFQKLDKESHEKMKWEFYKVPEHSKIDQGWKVPLARKQRKRAAKKVREAAVEITDQAPILYVHNAEIGVTIPAHPEQIFAVFRMGNR